MEPLEALAMPTHCALVGITTMNSLSTGSAQWPVRQAYIATNSTQRIAFATLQNTRHPENVLRVMTRPAYFEDMPYGMVVELYLAQDLEAGETVYLALAQIGASTYYPPQPIDDAG